MIPRPAFRRWPSLFTSLVLATAGMHAQEQTARLVKDANREPGGFGAGIYWVMPAGNGVVFPMDTLEHGSELWTSDGMPKGTRLLKDLVPGPGPSTLRSPVAFGDGKVAFLNEVWTTGNEVWVTDGTEAGTLRVFEGLPGDEGEVRMMAGTTGGVFFEHWEWALGNRPELFFSDGTATGTRALNPLVAGERRFSFPHSYTTSGPWCYFVGNDGEIWRSDGTEAGTTILIANVDPSGGRLKAAAGRLFMQRDADSEVAELWACSLEGGELTRLAPPAGTGWAILEEMVDMGDELFFIARSENYASSLWASDGTVAGTRRIPLMHGAAESVTYGSGMTAWNGSLYLTAVSAEGHDELWRTDGTPAGTIRLISFPAGFPYLAPYEVPATAEFFHFQVQNADGEWELWRTQGDATSTRRVRRAPGSYPFSAQGSLLAEGNAGLFFVGDQTTPDEALWRTRGNAAGAVRLTRPEQRTGPGISAYTPGEQPYEMLDGHLLAFFDTGRARELWRMNPDGSRARSVWKTPVPIVQDYGSVGFTGVTANGALFNLDDGNGVRQLWTTDGTRRGTRMLVDHGVTADDTYPLDFVKVGDVWFYSAVNWADPTKASLWKTDGTPASTMKIVAADGSAPAPNPGELVAFQDRLYFLATGVDGKPALWCSDGTADGTVKLKDTWPTNPESEVPIEVANLSVAAGKLFFLVSGPYSPVLWQSDGTAAGTAPVSPFASFSQTHVSPALDLAGVAIFQAYNQWWRHDATGTRPVQDTPDHHLEDWYPPLQRYAVAGAQLFYIGVEENDAELWVTDGTSAGTRRVKDLHPGPRSSYPAGMLAVGDVVYFIASEEDHGTELWRSDGTEAGTVLVADIEPGPASSMPQGLKVMGGKLYFSAIRRDVGRELFTIDLPAR